MHLKLNKKLYKTRKSRQILISPQNIFFRVQTFQRSPFAGSCNFCHTHRCWCLLQYAQIRSQARTDVWDPATEAQLRGRVAPKPLRATIKSDHLAKILSDHQVWPFFPTIFSDHLLRPSCHHLVRPDQTFHDLPSPLLHNSARFWQLRLPPRWDPIKKKQTTEKKVKIL